VQRVRVGRKQTHRHHRAQAQAQARRRKRDSRPGYGAQGGRKAHPSAQRPPTRSARTLLSERHMTTEATAMVEGSRACRPTLHGAATMTLMRLREEQSMERRHHAGRQVGALVCRAGHACADGLLHFTRAAWRLGVVVSSLAAGHSMGLSAFAAAWRNGSIGQFLFLYINATGFFRAFHSG
jgi:hypothetical protein